MSETSTLIGYGGRTIGREELALVPTPAATETHRPVPHHEIVQALVETLGFRHIGVVHDEYAVSPDGMKAFGVLDLATEMEGCRFSIGLRNSHDKNRLDARTLARLVRIDPQLLAPVKHRSAQAHRMVIRARTGLVRARTVVDQHSAGTDEVLRGAAARLPSAEPDPRETQGLSPELRAALEPLLGEIESLSERIGEYNEQIEQISKESYPEAARLKQGKGVGTLIALTYVLTLEDAHRFGKSRDVGCYVGLQPGRRNSGQSEPQLHISKEGDPYLRTLLVQGAHHILGPFGADSDLRRWGLKLAERGGKNGKKRAVIATARRLAVLL